MSRRKVNPLEREKKTCEEAGGKRRNVVKKTKLAVGRNAFSDDVTTGSRGNQLDFERSGRLFSEEDPAAEYEMIFTRFFLPASH